MNAALKRREMVLKRNPHGTGTQKHVTQQETGEKHARYIKVKGCMQTSGLMKIADNPT
jgi:hypothetical protein